MYDMKGMEDMSLNGYIIYRITTMKSIKLRNPVF
jgi:hypothetical protein